MLIFLTTNLISRDAAESWVLEHYQVLVAHGYNNHDITSHMAQIRSKRLHFTTPHSARHPRAHPLLYPIPSHHQRTPKPKSPPSSTPLLKAHRGCVHIRD